MQYSVLTAEVLSPLHTSDKCKLQHSQLDNRLRCTFTLIMVALCNRADHYIFILFLLLLSSFLFPRLISAVGDWMFTILRHMVWP